MNNRSRVRILAISGSLRAGASNTTLLQAARLLARPPVEVVLYDGIGALPAFNPDLDEPGDAGLPTVVAALRAQIGQADGLLISSPEYAHGIPGALKNALDWLVGSLEFPGKPVGLLSASGRSIHAKAQLIEVLTTMSARLIPDACVTIEMAGRQLDAAGVLSDSAMVSNLAAALEAIVHP